jgi:hypothetical protein
MREREKIERPDNTQDNTGPLKIEEREREKREERERGERERREKRERERPDNTRQHKTCHNTT